MNERTARSVLSEVEWSWLVRWSEVVDNNGSVAACPATEQKEMPKVVADRGEGLCVR